MFSSSAIDSERKKAYSYSYVMGYLTKGSYSNEQLRDELEKFLRSLHNGFVP